MVALLGLYSPAAAEIYNESLHGLPVLHGGIPSCPCPAATITEKDVAVHDRAGMRDHEEPEEHAASQAGLIAAGAPARKVAA